MQFTALTPLGIVEVNEQGQIQGQAKENTNPAPREVLKKLRETLRGKVSAQQWYTYNTKLTINAIKQSVTQDALILQTISSIDELDRAANMLSKRVREWYALIAPEVSEHYEKHEHFIEKILNQPSQELLREIGVEQTMGASLDIKDVQETLLLAKKVHALYTLRKQHEAYLTEIMQSYCPNILELAGATIGAKLIEHARSLKKLALMPASTVQMLGAEKALFRHLKTGARPPKHGLIINHQIVQRAQKNAKGKAARALADKIVLCARVDHFKGEPIAKKEKEKLEKRFML